MITFSVAFLLALGLSSLITPLVRSAALARGWVDSSVSSRKVHTTPVPRLGGIAIVVGFFAPLAGLLVVDTGVGKIFLENPRHVVGLFVGGTLIAAVGLLDDLRGLGPAKKFSAQFIIAGFMYSLGFSVEQIWTPWGALPLGAFGLVFTMVWIVGVINAMNLIDGLDGLASGVALVAVLTNLVIAASRGHVLMVLFMAALAGAILGFLLYNFNPASIFMGDTGSMFLGFVLATSSIITSQKSGAAVAMLVPILALGLPIMDTLLAMIRRAIRGMPLFAADKEHIHHKLLAMGYTQRRAVLTLYAICVAFAGLALASSFANGPQTALLLVTTGVLVAVLIRKLGYARGSSPELAATRQRNRAIREQVRDIGERLRSAALPAQAWEAVQPIGRSMGLAELSLSLLSAAEDGPPERSQFHWSSDAGDGEKLTIRMPIEAGSETYGMLEVAWQDGRRAIHRDDEIALELLRDHLAVAARRFSAAPKNVVALRRK